MNKDKTFEILKEIFEEMNGHAPEIDENIIENGHLDSFGMLQFIMNMEEKLNIKIEPEETNTKNFKDCNTVIDLIHSKL